PRRSPPPWSAEVTPNCFIVRDANGQQLAYVYYECEPGRRSAAKLLSEDEARRIERTGWFLRPRLRKPKQQARAAARQYVRAPAPCGSRRRGTLPQIH